MASCTSRIPRRSMVLAVIILLLVVIAIGIVLELNQQVTGSVRQMTICAPIGDCRTDPIDGKATTVKEKK